MVPQSKQTLEHLRTDWKKIASFSDRKANLIDIDGEKGLVNKTFIDLLRKSNKKTMVSIHQKV